MNRSQKRQADRGDAAQGRVSDSSWTTDGITVQVVRSERRKKSVTARLLNWHTLQVRAPADISDSDLRRIVQQFLAQVRETQSKLRHFASDEGLQQRAMQLNRTFFKGELRWRSIRFVGNQTKTFGSCSPARGTIRISDRLMRVPSFVLDYVIMHELVHLVHPDHSQAFWELVYRYDKTERARGYLIALELENDGLEAGEQSGAPGEMREDEDHADRERLAR
jgi:predicted metal-dependent hydrolase